MYDILEATRKLLKKRSERRKFYSLYRKALRDGILVRPEICSTCNQESDNIHGHHWSYKEEHAIDIIWLCRKCHVELHKKLFRENDSYML